MYLSRFLLSICLLVAVFLAATGCPCPPKVTVPNVIGRTQAEAETLITDAGLTVGVVTEVFNSSPVGQVISQDPAADAQVAEGTAVDLEVSSGPWEPDSSTFDVELAPDAVMVDEANLDLLVDSDQENHVYTLNAAEVQSRGLDLTAGNILILHGIAVRRIASVAQEGDNLVIETDYVPLNEVIPNGTIEWDYGVEFTPEKIKSVEIPGVGIIYPKQGTPIQFSFEMGEFTYDLQATLDTEVSTFDFTVTKDLGGSASARFKATGDIKRFRSRDRISFQGGQLQEFGHELNGMQGDVTLELVVAASGQDVVNLELPITIMKVPFVIGFIPVELNIKIQFVINASVPADGSAMVKTNFVYNSDLGFTYNGVDMSAGGRLGSITFGQETNQTGASSAIAANFGIGFPRVELSILLDSVVPWAQTAFLVGGTYTFFPACQTADALFLGAGGYDLGLFGLNLLSGRVTFFQEKKELLRAGDCPEESKTIEAYDAEAALLGGLPWETGE